MYEIGRKGPYLLRLANVRRQQGHGEWLASSSRCVCNRAAGLSQRFHWGEWGGRRGPEGEQTRSEAERVELRMAGSATDQYVTQWRWAVVWGLTRGRIEKKTRLEIVYEGRTPSSWGIYRVCATTRRNVTREAHCGRCSWFARG
jgi:hypothetical protein